MTSELKRLAPLADFEEQPGYVYLADDGRSFKIGCSLDPWALSQSRKTGNPTYRLLKEWATMRMRESEKRLHCIFNHCRMPGTNEWYDLMPDVVEFLGFLDDWAMCQFSAPEGEHTVESFKLTPTYRRLGEGRLVFLFILNPYTVLHFHTISRSLVHPVREELFELFELNPMGFLAACDLQVPIQFRDGMTITLFHFKEHRRVKDGARYVPKEVE